MKTPIAKSKTSTKKPSKTTPAKTAAASPAEGQTWKHNRTGRQIVLGTCTAKQCTASNAVAVGEQRFDSLIRFSTLLRDYTLVKAAPRRAAKK